MLRLPRRSSSPAPARRAHTRRRVRAVLPHAGAHGDLFRCRECGTVQQPSLPRRRRAARAVPRDARRRLPRRGGRAGARRRGGCSTWSAGHVPRGPPARRRLRPRAAARRGAPARLRRRGPRAVARRRAPRARAPRTSTCASSRSRTPASTSERFDVDRPGRRDRAPRGPGRRARRAARELLAPGGALLRRHARPVVAHRAARGPALVGLPARRTVPAAARARCAS